MRLGQDEEARKQLEQAYNAGLSESGNRELPAPAR